MARTVAQIMKELDTSGGYASDRQLLNTQLNGLPNQLAAQEAGLNAKLEQANEGILQSARSRGVGFSGMPIAEQTKYAATDYAPALANLRTQSEQNRLGILQSLNSLSRDQRTQAQSIFDANRSYEEQVRQFNEQQKLAREQLAAQQRAAAAAQAAASAGDYLATVRSASNSTSTPKAASGPSDAERQIYSRVKSMQNIAGSDPTLFNKLLKRLEGGNAADKAVAATVRRNINQRLGI